VPFETKHDAQVALDWNGFHTPVLDSR